MRSLIQTVSILVGATALITMSAFADGWQPQYPGKGQIQPKYPKDSKYKPQFPVPSDYQPQYPDAQYDQQYQPQFPGSNDQYEPSYPNTTIPHQPQYPHQPGGQNQQWIATEAYNATGGACQIAVNPHSYACTHWNFAGNQVFPLFQLDWDSGLQGEWFTVTYVNRISENDGPEFYMAKNPHNPLQPMGVINKNSNTQMGSMWIQGNTMVWNNWLGHTLATSPQSFRWMDAYTVEMQAYEGQYIHLFRCRDFNRNNNHHLLCDWYLWSPQNQQWMNKGYFGFLTRQVWDQFANGHH